jgi:hypothetical protein
MPLNRYTALFDERKRNASGCFGGGQGGRSGGGAHYDVPHPALTAAGITAMGTGLQRSATEAEGVAGNVAAEAASSGSAPSRELLVQACLSLSLHVQPR